MQGWGQCVWSLDRALCVMAMQRAELSSTDGTVVEGKGLGNSLGAVTTGQFGLNLEKQESSRQVGAGGERHSQFSFDHIESEVPQKSREGCRPRTAIGFGHGRTWAHFRRTVEVRRGVVELSVWGYEWRRPFLIVES